MNTFAKSLLSSALFLICTIATSIKSLSQELLLNPTSTVFQLNSDIPEYICPSFDVNDMKEEDSLNDLGGITPSRFAKGFELDISTNNAGQWETIDSVHVWRYKISSNGAYSMNALLENINRHC